MSFNLYVQQNQWIVVTLLGGAALMALFCLTYRAMWRPREEESEVEPSIRITGIVSFFKWVVSFTPWVLILIAIASAAYTVTHLATAATHLPNL